jgi:hypothetical protein
MQSIEILNFVFQFAKGIEQRSHPRHFFHIGLGTLPIIPKIWRAHARFQRGCLFLKFGDVKETSAARGDATSNLQDRFAEAH